MKNDLLDLTLKRRSIRNYLDEDIDDEVIGEILNVALTAPSSWGGHPVHFIVVKDKEMIRKIAHCKAMGAAPLMRANACIVVMADTSSCELWIEDASVASSYIYSTTTTPFLSTYPYLPSFLLKNNVFETNISFAFFSSNFRL